VHGGSGATLPHHPPTTWRARKETGKLVIRPKKNGERETTFFVFCGSGAARADGTDLFLAGTASWQPTYDGRRRQSEQVHCFFDAGHQQELRKIRFSRAHCSFFFFSGRAPLATVATQNANGTIIAVEVPAASREANSAGRRRKAGRNGGRMVGRSMLMWGLGESGSMAGAVGVTLAGPASSPGVIAADRSGHGLLWIVAAGKSSAK